jgi:hypothetical protein
LDLVKSWTDVDSDRLHYAGVCGECPAGVAARFFGVNDLDNSLLQNIIVNLPVQRCGRNDAANIAGDGQLSDCPGILDAITALLKRVRIL